jgi:cytochrome c553
VLKGGIIAAPSPALPRVLQTQGREVFVPRLSFVGNQVRRLEELVMLRLIVIAGLASFCLWARADPFAQADPMKGRPLAEKSCVACHSSKFGGDGTKIYTRPDHRVRSADQLMRQVTVCSQAANTDWSKQDIANVAAYLNKTFYKFP